MVYTLLAYKLNLEMILFGAGKVHGQVLWRAAPSWSERTALPAHLAPRPGGCNVRSTGSRRRALDTVSDATGFTEGGSEGAGWLRVRRGTGRGRSTSTVT